VGIWKFSHKLAMMPQLLNDEQYNYKSAMTPQLLNDEQYKTSRQ
jgi:hypothetical protein